MLSASKRILLIDVKRSKLILLIAVLSIVAIFVLWWAQRAEAPKGSSSSSNQQTLSFNKALYSTSDPNSIWVVVNKKRPLQPKNFVPKDLVVPNVKLRLGSSQEQMHVSNKIVASIESLFGAASAAGFTLSLGSGYRSYGYQQNLYDGYVSTDGQASADRTSARPGFSEHQTGLAFDVEATNMKCHLDKCLANTPDGQWLAAHAYEFGFIVRYPADKVAITGYDFEPWHFRYVGVLLATEMHKDAVTTLEEFFGISGGTSY